MKSQISINVDADILAALHQLASIQHRSLSEMAAILIAQRLEQLRQEYRQDSTLPSLPKHTKYTTRRWDQRCRDLYGA